MTTIEERIDKIVRSVAFQIRYQGLRAFRQSQPFRFNPTVTARTLVDALASAHFAVDRSINLKVLRANYREEVVGLLMPQIESELSAAQGRLATATTRAEAREALTINRQNIAVNVEKRVRGIQSTVQRERAVRDPQIKFLRWRTMEDGRVRPTHQEMNSVTAPPEDPIWQVWIPGAVDYGCRCVWEYIYEDVEPKYPDTYVMPEEQYRAL